MSKQETIMLMAMLGAFYSGGKNDPKLQAEAWYLILQKYDYQTAQKAVLNFAENDTRDYATFPAVGVIVKEIKAQELREKKPIKEVMLGVQYGKNYDELSKDAKRLIGFGKYNEWLKINAEEFAANANRYAETLSTGRLMIGHEQ